MHISETLTKIVIDNNQAIVLSRLQMKELRDLLNAHLVSVGDYNTNPFTFGPGPVQFYATNPDTLTIPCSSIDVGVVQFPTDEKYITGQPVFDNKNFGCIAIDAAT